MIRFVLPVVVLTFLACTSSGISSVARMERVDAPIASIEIHKTAAKPPNAAMVVVTGLRNGCEEFSHYSLRRVDDSFSLSIFNLTSESPDTACTNDYRSVITSIPLEGPIEECRRYSVEANGELHEVIYTFTQFMETQSEPCPPGSEGTPDSQSIIDRTMASYLRDMEALVDAVTWFSNPDGPGGSIEEVETISSELTSYLSFFSGLDGEQLRNVNEIYGVRMADLAQRIASRTFWAVQITGNTSIATAVERIPAFAITSTSSVNP